MQNRIASFLAISAIALGTSAVQAGELDYPPPLETSSSVSRAQVQQELQAARETGPAFRGELDPQALFADGNASDVTRAQVVQQRELAREQGLISRGNLDYPPVQG